MRARAVAALIGFVVLACLFPLTGAAQAVQACTQEMTITGFPERPPGFTGTLDQLLGLPPTAWCAPNCFFECACYYYTGCAPADAPYEIRCLACTAQGAHPIDLATGNVFITQADINLPGLGGGLRLTRTWNSTWPAIEGGMMPFMFGPNWTATYQERVFIGSDQYLKYARSDGSFWSFAPTGGGAYPTYAVAAPANAGATATENSNTNAWTVTLKNGEQHTFDPVSGDLTSIIDRNGNTTTVSYDALNRVSTVTDPASRHLYFNYVNNSGFLVSSVTSDAGITWSYAYDSQGRLSQVTKPDNTTISFQYQSNTIDITAVLDTNGVVLESHTYDLCNRGLTSSRANGVQSLTVQYPTGCGETMP